MYLEPDSNQTTKRICISSAKGFFTLRIVDKNGQSLFRCDMSLEEALSFLHEIDGRDIYEFLGNGLVLTRVNLQRIHIILGRRVDHFLTDGLLRPFTKSELNEIISDPMM